MRNFFVKGLVLSALLLGAAPCFAAEVWTGTDDNNWFNDNNWLDGTAPDGTGDVFINIATPVLIGSAGAAAQATTLEAGSMLTVQSGGELSGTKMIVGFGIGSNSALNIQGQMNMSDNVTIGDQAGVANVTVDGGVVNTVDTLLGYSFSLNGGFGNLTLANGSQWNSTSNMVVGFSGSGNVYLYNLSQLNVGSLQIAGSYNPVDFSPMVTNFIVDSGSSVAANELYIKNSIMNNDTVDMQILNGSSVILDTNGLGFTMGQASQLNNTSLLVSGGSLFQTPSSIIAGSVQVIGTGTLFQSDTIQLGAFESNGSLSVSNGGVVQVADDIFVGANNGSTTDSTFGVLTVQDADSTIATNGSVTLYVGEGTVGGNAAQGYFNVLNGAEVSLNEMQFSTNGGYSEILIDGANSQASASSVAMGIGAGSDGQMVVSNGALAQFGFTTIGGGGGNFDVIVDNASMAPFFLAMGVDILNNSLIGGTSTLTLQNGASMVSLAGLVGLIGSAELTIDRSAALVTDFMYVGGADPSMGAPATSGSGALSIVNGGSFVVQTNNSPSSPLAFGLGLGEGSGGLLIDGAGSSLQVQDSAGITQICIACNTIQNQSNVDIVNGGIFETQAEELIIADDQGVAQINIDGTGSILDAIASDVFIGHDNGFFTGSAIFTISNGGLVKASSLTLGDNGGAFMQVYGAGASMDVSNNLLIGDNGFGSLEVFDTATVTADGMNVGIGNDSIVYVSGAGSKITVGNDMRLGIDTNGSGTLTVENDAEVQAATIIFGQTGFGAASGIINIGSNPLSGVPLGAGILTVGSIETDNGSGTINFYHSTPDYDFSTVMSGDIDVNAMAGTTILSANSTYTGATTVLQNATLIVDGRIESETTIDDDGNLGGSGRIVNNVISQGFIIPGANLSSGNYTALTIEGNYSASNGAAMILRTALGDDTSLTDRLILDGGTVSGSTLIGILNDGGLGAQTTGDGIMIVQAINGATTSAGNFALDGGRAEAGLYKYEIFQGSLDQTDQYSFFLRSTTLRSAIPVYAATPAMSLAFGIQTLGTLHDRTDMGQQLRADSPALQLGIGGGLGRGLGQTELPEGAWIRAFGGENRFKSEDAAGSGYEGSVEGIQVGKDIWRTEHDDGSRDQAGLYVAQGHAKADMTSNAGNAGTTSFNATSLGAYWTRFDAKGAYVNGGLQYSRIHAMKISPTTGGGISPGGNMGSASIEAGKPFKFAKRSAIEPQAQLIYQALKLEDANDGVSDISFDTQHTVTARAGVQVRHSFDTDSGLAVQPWTRFNVWHAIKSESVMTLDGTNTFTTPLDGTQGEVQVGVTLGRAEDEQETGWSLYMNGGYQFKIAGANASGWMGSVGARFNW